MSYYFRHNKPLTWKFFETSHGKGVVDGIGGNAKSVVRKRMLTKDGSVRVNSALDFIKIAEKLISQTKMIHMDKEIINNFNSYNSIFSNSFKIPGFQKIHVIKMFPDGRFEFAENALEMKNFS